MRPAPRICQPTENTLRPTTLVRIAVLSIAPVGRTSCARKCSISAPASPECNQRPNGTHREAAHFDQPAVVTALASTGRGTRSPLHAVRWLTLPPSVFDYAIATENPCRFSIRLKAATARSLRRLLSITEKRQQSNALALGLVRNKLAITPAVDHQAIGWRARFSTLPFRSPAVQASYSGVFGSGSGGKPMTFSTASAVAASRLQIRT